MSKIYGKKLISILILPALLISLSLPNLSACQQQGQPAEEKKTPVIGLAWPDRTQEYNESWCLTIEAAGAIPVILEEVRFNEDWYDDSGKLQSKCLDSGGMLSQACANDVKLNTYFKSNVESVLQGVDAVIFPGGDDISLTLLENPIPQNTYEGYNPTRDISDYLLMNYCIDNNIPTLCICRGIQMLGIVAGCSLVEDIPNYCEQNSIPNKFAHRMSLDLGEENMDYVPHAIDIVESNAYLSGATNGASKTALMPSWHHQSITNLENTQLKINAYSDTPDGYRSIEAVEYTGKRLIVGIQFHPEYIVREKLYSNMDHPPFSYNECLPFLSSFVSLV